MLKYFIAALSMLLLSAAYADAVEVPSALHARRGLTAGSYDHFLGQLHPDGTTLFFAGNANSTVEIFTQNLVRGTPKRLFEESADINQPRISPDGKHILYISYRDHAAGDVCSFDLGTRTRRCLGQRKAHIMHIFWFPDSEHIGILGRERSSNANQLWKITRRARQGDTGQLLFTGNMLAPAISPDGRWLAYIPFARSSRDMNIPGDIVRAEPGLMLLALDDPSSAPVHFIPDLPGTSGFPAFSLDGSYLYFTQYLNDSNFDGTIDGNDNGVLFRIPFAAVVQQADTRQVEQLTSGGYNCQYPVPAHDRLIATCARAGYLQIYSLPLTGLVPEQWPAQRKRSELEVSRDAWEQLIILASLLAETRDREQRVRLEQRMVMTHMALHEYESAEQYLRYLRRDAPTGAVISVWGEIMAEFIAFRRAEQRLGHGKLTEDFIATQQARLARLENFSHAENASIQHLIMIVRNEILFVLGDRGGALTLFDSIDIANETSALVVRPWARLADTLLHDLEDRSRWAAAHLALSSHAALSEREQLAFARRYVDGLIRGRSLDERIPLLHAARASVAGHAAAELMLEVELALDTIRHADHQTRYSTLSDLWARRTSFESHRAVAMAIISRAAREDWEILLVEFAQRWLKDIPAEHPERKYAEALFAEVMLERAYVETQRGHLEAAREHFREIALAVNALEAHSGYLETSLQLNIPAQTLLAEYRTGRMVSKEAAINAFGEAYVIARDLPQIEDAGQHAQMIKRARILLAPVIEAFPRSAEVHHLYAYLAHRHYHRTHDKSAAMLAHMRYHLALDLAVDNPRRRASLLTELGLLQASLGNHRIALTHFTERERLPFLAPADELALRLAKGRSLFHLAAYQEAKAELALAVPLTKPGSGLERFAAIDLERAALYHYAAGAHTPAATLYQDLLTVIGNASLAARLKAHIGLGASLLAASQAEAALEPLEAALALLDSDEPFRQTDPGISTDTHLDRDALRPLITGLLAQGYRARGDLVRSQKMLLQRRDFYQARIRRLNLDADLLEIAHIGQQLTEIAWRLGDKAAATTHLIDALAHADKWRKRTNTQIEAVTLALVRAATELHLFGAVPRSAFKFDLVARLQQSYEAITLRPNPRWANERYLFPVYLTLLHTG